MTEKLKWRDAFEEKPDESGWYAVHYCWDAQEGSFLGAIQFKGGEWRESLPLSNFSGPFDTEDHARKWAEDNDISF